MQIDRVMSEVTSQTVPDRGGQDNRNDAGRRRQEKKDMETATFKFKGATSGLKGKYIATYQEARGRSEVMDMKTMEALKRHCYRICQCPQDLADFFAKGAKPALK